MKRALHDLASLAARMGVGGIFFANGWQKLEAGLNATQAQFTELHAPAPYVWAAVTMLVELVGGTLLIAGLAVPAVGLLLFAEALAVFVLTAGDTGLPLTGGAIELIVALGAASVLLAVVGGGRVSVDHMVVIKRREAEAAGEFAAEAEADAVIAALRPPRPGEEGVTTGAAASGPQARPASTGSPSSGSHSSTGSAGTHSSAGSPVSPRSPGQPDSGTPGTSGTSGTSATRPAPAVRTGAAKQSPAAPADAAPEGGAGEEAPPATGRRAASPRPRRTRREDDTTTESRAEAPGTTEATTP